jgi:hypothetical protein
MLQLDISVPGFISKKYRSRAWLLYDLVRKRKISFFENKIINSIKFINSMIREKI